MAPLHFPPTSGALDGPHLSAQLRAGIRRWRSAAPAVACALVLACPWARTGATMRSGYGLVAAVHASGFALPGPLGTLSWLVPAVPALAALVLALAFAGAPRTRRATAAATGLVTLCYSVALFWYLGPRLPVGPWAGAVAGLGAVTYAVAPSARGLVPSRPTNTHCHVP